MTTASSSATLAQDTYAHMQAWVGELCGQLIACGLTQTADTGQLTLTGSGSAAIASWTSAALPTGTGVGNAVAFIIFRFNDTLQSGGSPVFIRLDFGGGGLTTSPQMWITVGASTNGAGVVAGTAGTSRMTQVACFTGNTAASLITAYTSRFVYNSTFGYLGIVFKLGSLGNNTAGTPIATGSVMLFRTNDSGGNASGNAVVLITNSATSTGIQTSASGVMQCMTWAAGAGSTVYPTLSATNSVLWIAIPSTTFVFGLAATLENSIAFVTPLYTMDPGLKFSAYNGVALISDFPIGNTASFAMIGSTSLTFISVGVPFGNSTGNGFAGVSNPNLTYVMLWQ